MKPGRWRVWLPVCAAALGLVWSGSSSAGSAGKPADLPAGNTPSTSRDRPSSERGIVQSVSADGLVLKTLDGSTVAVAVDARTRVLVDGHPASILDVRPGFVAVVTERGKSGQAAQEVDAFSPAHTPPHSGKPLAGVLRTVSHNRLVLVSEGKSVTMVIDGATQLHLDGEPSSISELKAGLVVVVRPTADSSKDNGKKKAIHLRELFAFSPPRQASAHLYRGTIATVTGQAIALRTEGGGTVRIAVTAKTRVFFNGARGSIGQLKPGFVTVARTGARRELWAFGAL